MISGVGGEVRGAYLRKRGVGGRRAQAGILCYHTEKGEESVCAARYKKGEKNLARDR